ncbi:ATP-binding cassette domain-containing protein [Micromonospora andamanensis]|uniref:ABC transporter ATP-binding protein n=1 Tax=Micromonospora andamanensis TaxID=1287068 RepID=UPI001950AB2E|nr:ABC transporter ATP-binding protein [Micromonospora andamanensis]GIJ41472.1 ABC transporter ATP-binding protein [Micromonospora andamanensis]
MNEDAVTATALTKTYPGASAPAVDQMTFSVPTGQSVGLLGPNGAGKTTLLKLICGVSPPTAGQLLVHGVAPGGVAKRDLAVVHQSGPFDMMLTVQDNLRIAAAFRGLSWRRIRSRAAALLEEFDLAGKSDDLVFTLSGGQRRRLQVVRALLRVPKLLLLDEPSAGLDVEGRRRVWDMLDELRRTHGLTLVWTSHHMDELERNCERILVVQHGRILRDGSSEQLKDEAGQVTAELRTGSPDDWGAVAECARLAGLTPEYRGELFVLTGDDLRRRLPTLIAALTERQVAIESVALTSSSLEDAFLALTRAEVSTR